MRLWVILCVFITRWWTAATRHLLEQQIRTIKGFIKILYLMRINWWTIKNSSMWRERKNSTENSQKPNESIWYGRRCRRAPHKTHFSVFSTLQRMTCRKIKGSDKCKQSYREKDRIDRTRKRNEKWWNIQNSNQFFSLRPRPNQFPMSPLFYLKSQRRWSKHEIEIKTFVVFA